MKFEEFFSEQHIKKIYEEKICYSTAVGIDKINNTYFMKYLNSNVKKISNDILNNAYKFKPYKVVLIPKDIGVKPRKICIPTISDRIVIEIIKEIIYHYYEGYHLNIGVSNIVNDFIDTYTSKKYYYYIKTDLSSYFDTINHSLLINKLKKQITDGRVIELIEKVLINKQNYNKEKSNNIPNNSLGVPQGLGISTLLANIYMYDIDNEFMKNKNIKYYRYVDDIFIFCNKNLFFYYIKLLKKLKKLKLKRNKNKTSLSKIDNSSFEFLGYSINDKLITVKRKSIRKLENSLEEIFKNYHFSKDKNIDELTWRLNIRISGAIAGNRRYGWLFYFKNINDMRLLYHFDDYIGKLKRRYKVEEIETKTFVRTYYKMQMKSLKNSKYFLNIDTVTMKEKKDILKKITSFSNEEIDLLTKKQLDYNFKKAIFKCLKSLEKDLDSIS